MATKTATAVRCTVIVERLGDRTLGRLPEAASAALPSRGQVVVTGTVHGEERTAVIEPDGRRGHWIDLDGVDAPVGTEILLHVMPAAAWPEPEIPGDLRAALAGAPELTDVWEDITPMARWEWVRWVGATRSADTRAKRVTVTLSKLADGKRRPCCFDLSSCTDPELARSGKLIEG